MWGLEDVMKTSARVRINGTHKIAIPNLNLLKIAHISNFGFLFSNPVFRWAWWAKNQEYNWIFGSGLESGGGPGQKLGQFRPDPAQKPIKTMQNEDPKETTNWNTVLAVSTTKLFLDSQSKLKICYQKYSNVLNNATWNERNTIFLCYPQSLSCGQNLRAPNLAWPKFRRVRCQSI